MVAVHGQMRLPHLGISRSVPYEQLYVEPVLRAEQELWEVPDLTALALPGWRSVILGDPGAGKSTLAAKLAHDVASDLVSGAEGRVPFLLVLRNFAGSFRKGGKGLTHYLEQVCGDPYNLQPPPNVIDYLLRNGRAMVLLDGLDELVEIELRRKFVQLVDGFISRYPLVPVLVTARRIGYADAPLDRRLFTVGVVAELDENQVAQYVKRWFALDASTVESERLRMAKSFLVESKDIAELRANPLLLALLCAMYSSEHYIPRNLAQVYERCAVMLFDRWDSMRGIALPLQFQGRLRGAVQYLAWRLFQAEESGKALPRHRIVRILADYSVAKGFDEDEAIATAEQFLEFCTGRAWILTDVGATETEPRYGFTHRTFLEYFAAEYLVRTHPTADQLWQALRPRVLFGEWEVVAQIALQLLDRNMDRGVDDFLRKVLAEMPADTHQRWRFHGFAAQTLGYVHPRHDVISEVVTTALQTSLDCDIRERFQYWVADETFVKIRILDGAMRALIYQCAPENLPLVRRILTASLDRWVESGSETAMFAALRLAEPAVTADERAVGVWEAVRQDVCDRHASTLAAWSERAPWASIVTRAKPDRIVARFGPWPLYLSDAFLSGSRPSIAEHLLGSGSSSGMRPQLTRLCDALIAARRPWISDGSWWNELSSMTQVDTWWARTFKTPRHELPPAAMVLLALPYVEVDAQGHFSARLSRSVPWQSALATARAEGKVSADMERSLPFTALSKEVRAFLASWVQREFELVKLPPSR